MIGDYRVEPLGGHDRSRFSSGNEDLDRYFRTAATQDLRRRFTTAFVAVDAANDIIGFYTLSATSVVMDALPELMTRKLPRYDVVPAVLIGRLAVSQDRQGHGFGAELLFDALRRSADAEVGAYLALVHPKDARAHSFYGRHGFHPLAAHQGMFLPLSTVQAARSR